MGDQPHRPKGQGYTPRGLLVRPLWAGLQNGKATGPLLVVV